MHDSDIRPALRPLGAFERIIDLYIGRNPVQFSLAVELEAAVSSDQLHRALAALQRAHPMLAAGIDRSGERPMFHGTAERIPVTSIRGLSWEQVASDEQSRPIDVDGSPLVRATLVTEAEGHRGSVVVLTFSHQVADGRGALRAVHDLLAALEGRPIPFRPVPPDQERLLEGRPAPDVPETDDRTPEPDPAPPAPASIRPFDGTGPLVESDSLGVVVTADLRATARAHASTVQGALCAAAAQALSARLGLGSVRINVPIDLRTAVGLDDDVVNRFTATTVVLQPTPDGPLWPLAQEATSQLRAARDTARSAALMLASLDPRDAEAAEVAMLAATASDIEITNLGVMSSETAAAVAIWGPTMTTQVMGERVLGVITQAGSLRMVLTSHGGTGGLLADVAARLTAR